MSTKTIQHTRIIDDKSLGAICSKDRKKKWTDREESVDKNTETEE